MTPLQTAIYNATPEEVLGLAQHIKDYICEGQPPQGWGGLLVSFKASGVIRDAIIEFTGKDI